jgi:hypothetical protein
MSAEDNNQSEESFSNSTKKDKGKEKEKEEFEVKYNDFEEEDSIEKFKFTMGNTEVFMKIDPDGYLTIVNRSMFDCRIHFKNNNNEQKSIACWKDKTRKYTNAKHDVIYLKNTEITRTNKYVRIPLEDIEFYFQYSTKKYHDLKIKYTNWVNVMEASKDMDDFLSKEKSNKKDFWKKQMPPKSNNYDDDFPETSSKKAKKQKSEKNDKEFDLQQAKIELMKIESELINIGFSFSAEIYKDGSLIFQTKS